MSPVLTAVVFSSVELLLLTRNLLDMCWQSEMTSERELEPDQKPLGSSGEFKTSALSGFVLFAADTQALFCVNIRYVCTCQKRKD